MIAVPFLKTKSDLAMIKISIYGMEQPFAAVIDTGTEISAVDKCAFYTDRTSTLLALSAIDPYGKELSKDAIITFAMNGGSDSEVRLTEPFMRCDIIDNYDSEDVEMLPVVMIIGGDILNKLRAHIDYQNRMLVI